MVRRPPRGITSPVSSSSARAAIVLLSSPGTSANRGRWSSMWSPSGQIRNSGTVGSNSTLILCSSTGCSIKVSPLAPPGIEQWSIPSPMTSSTRSPSRRIIVQSSWTLSYRRRVSTAGRSASAHTSRRPLHRSHSDTRPSSSESRIVCVSPCRLERFLDSATRASLVGSSHPLSSHSRRDRIRLGTTGQLRAAHANDGFCPERAASDRPSLSRDSPRRTATSGWDGHLSRKNKCL